MTINSNRKQIVDNLTFEVMNAQGKVLDAIKDERFVDAHLYRDGLYSEVVSSMIEFANILTKQDMVKIMDALSIIDKLVPVKWTVLRGVIKEGLKISVGGRFRQ